MDSPTLRTGTRLPRSSRPIGLFDLATARSLIDRVPFGRRQGFPDAQDLTLVESRTFHELHEVIGVAQGCEEVQGGVITSPRLCGGSWSPYHCDALGSVDKRFGKRDGRTTGC